MLLQIIIKTKYYMMCDMAAGVRRTEHTEETNENGF